MQDETLMPAGRRRVTVNVDGRKYVVEVGDLNTSPLQVTVDGRAYQVEIETVEAAAPARPAAELEKVVRQAPARAPLPAPPAGAQTREVRAPMPGNILEVAVRPGDRVQHGQTLCALEAMKMKSAIRSPRAGVIAAVRAADGQTVSHGDVLFTFEAE